MAASPLVLCWISYVVAPSQAFAIPMLAIPAAAILGSRHGAAARWQVAILLAPMLVSFGIGPVGFTRTAGIYPAALLATRVAGDSRARAAILSATEPPGPLFLGLLLLAMPWFVASPIFYGTQLSTDLWFLVMTLLLVIGAGQVPLGPIVRLVIAAWFFGLALRVLGLPLSGPFGSIGFNLSSPADLLTALLALYGPRLLRARLPRLQGSTAAGLAVLLLVALFVGALLARLRLAPGMESAFGPIAQVGLVTDATMALISAGTAVALPGYWWLAPAAFALARLPMAQRRVPTRHARFAGGLAPHRRVVSHVERTGLVARRLGGRPANQIAPWLRNVVHTDAGRKMSRGSRPRPFIDAAAVALDILMN